MLEAATTGEICAEEFQRWKETGDLARDRLREATCRKHLHGWKETGDLRAEYSERQIQCNKQVKHWKRERNDIKPAACCWVEDLLTGQQNGKLTLPPMPSELLKESREWKDKDGEPIAKPLRTVATMLGAWVSLGCLDWREDALLGKGEQLVDLLQCCRRQVQKAVNLLVDGGWLVRVFRYRYEPGFRGRGADGTPGTGRKLKHPQDWNAYRPGPRLRGAWQSWRRTLNEAREKRRGDEVRARWAAEQRRRQAEKTQLRREEIALQKEVRRDQQAGLIQDRPICDPTAPAQQAVPCIPPDPMPVDKPGYQADLSPEACADFVARRFFAGVGPEDLPRAPGPQPVDAVEARRVPAAGRGHTAAAEAGQAPAAPTGQTTPGREEAHKGGGQNAGCPSDQVAALRRQIAEIQTGGRAGRRTAAAAAGDQVEHVRRALGEASALLQRVLEHPIAVEVLEALERAAGALAGDPGRARRELEEARRWLEMPGPDRLRPLQQVVPRAWLLIDAAAREL